MKTKQIFLAGRIENKLPSWPFSFLRILYTLKKNQLATSGANIPNNKDMEPLAVRSTPHNNGPAVGMF